MTKIILGVITSLTAMVIAIMTTTVAGQALSAIIAADVLNWLYPDAWYNPWVWLEFLM